MLQNYASLFFCMWKDQQNCNNNKKIGKNLQLKIDSGHGLVIAKTDPPCLF